MSCPWSNKPSKRGKELRSLNNDGLRAETKKIQEIINQDLKGIDDQLAALHQNIADNPALDINEKESVFLQIDKLEEDRNKELEKVLLKVLPKAFAIVRETARRFKENEYLEVTAQDFDIQISATNENVKIEGDKARWYNTVDGGRQHDHLGHGALRSPDYRGYRIARR